MSDAVSRISVHAKLAAILSSRIFLFQAEQRMKENFTLCTMTWLAPGLGTNWIYDYEKKHDRYLDGSTARSQNNIHVHVPKP